MYAVRAGNIKIIDDLQDGHSRIARLVQAGDLFGLEAVAEECYPLRAVAIGKCDICAAPREALLAAMTQRPELALALMRFLLRDAARNRGQIGAGGQRDACAKVASFLLSLLPSPTPGSSPIALQLPLSRQEIGELLGLSAETVSRALTVLRNEGVARINGRRVVIRALSELRAKAGNPDA